MIKKILFVWLVSINVFGQDLFPGNYPNALLNKNVQPVKIADVLQKFGYKNFYKKFDKKTLQIVNKKDKPFPLFLDYNNIYTEYSKLVNFKFIVTDVFKIEPKYEFDDLEYVIEIFNSDIGYLYHVYNSRYAHTFELDVLDDITFPTEYYCSKLISKKDKFNGNEAFLTPTESRISFSKFIEGKDTYVYMSVYTYGINPDKKNGLYILFDDGSKIIKPNEAIETKPDNVGYKFTCFALLNDDDIKKLSSKIITDVKIYVYDDEKNKKSATIIKEYFNCLIK